MTVAMLFAASSFTAAAVVTTPVAPFHAAAARFATHSTSWRSSHPVCMVDATEAAQEAAMERAVVNAAEKPMHWFATAKPAAPGALYQAWPASVAAGR